MNKSTYWFIKNAQRTLFALLYTGFWAVFMTSMQAVSDNRAIAAGLHKQASQPLPDLIMDRAPSWLSIHAADWTLNALIYLSEIMFLVAWWWRIKAYGLVEAHFRSFRQARRFMWILSFAYAFRAFTVLSTTMPMSDARCSIRHRQWHEIVLFVGELMLHKGNSCTDKIFSGHSTMATLLCLTWLGALWRPGRVSKASLPQAPSNPLEQARNIPAEALKSVEAFKPLTPASVPLWRKLASLGIVLWTLVIYAACILCKNHYTIDILVAFAVTGGLFGIYRLSTRLMEQLSWSGALPLYNAKRDGPVYTAAAQDDPERGLCFSPISMQEITPASLNLTENAKPAPSSADSQPQESINISSAFERYLRVIAWMDGFDLQQKSGIRVVS